MRQNITTSSQDGVNQLLMNIYTSVLKSIVGIQIISTSKINEASALSEYSYTVFLTDGKISQIGLQTYFLLANVDNIAGFPQRGIAMFYTVQ